MRLCDHLPQLEAELGRPFGGFDVRVACNPTEMISLNSEIIRIPRLKKDFAGCREKCPR
jgi:hypothetical protein